MAPAQTGEHNARIIPRGTVPRAQCCWMGWFFDAERLENTREPETERIEIFVSLAPQWAPFPPFVCDDGCEHVEETAAALCPSGFLGKFSCTRSVQFVFMLDVCVF